MKGREGSGVACAWRVHVQRAVSVSECVQHPYPPQRMMPSRPLSSLCFWEACKVLKWNFSLSVGATHAARPGLPPPPSELCSPETGESLIPPRLPPTPLPSSSPSSRPSWWRGCGPTRSWWTCCRTPGWSQGRGATGGTEGGAGGWGAEETSTRKGMRVRCDEEKPFNFRNAFIQ